MPQTLTELTDNFLGGFKGCALLEVVDSFRREKPLGEMMSYLLRLPEAHQYLTPREEDSREHKKDFTKAQEARALGNQYYKKEQYEMAVVEYSRSIILAPHPPHRNYPTAEQREKPLIDASEFLPFLLSEEKDPKMLELCLSYANRSAALMELGLHNKCLRDIYLALKFGFQKVLRYKLIRRWAYCLIACKKHYAAGDLVLVALKALGDLPCDDSTRVKAREALQETYKQCRGMHDLGFPICHLPTLPIYSEEVMSDVPAVANPNKTIPVLNTAVGVAYSEAKGRHLVATREIIPGEVLSIEKSYATVLQQRQKDFVCTNCSRECQTPFPCPECSKMVFCSLICQREALSKYHKIECPIWPALQSLCLPPHVLLACRVLTTTSFETLTMEEPRLRRETETRQKATLGYNEKGIFKSSEYRAVYHLNTNQEHRPHLDVFNACISAFVLLKLLQRSGRFFSKGGQAVTASDKDLLLVGTALCSHILSLSCNSIPINHVTKIGKSFPVENLGHGIFPTLSLANHSCDPTASVTTNGVSGMMIAIHLIPKGSEITLSYGVTHLQTPRERRRAHLLEAYRFHCKCQACEHNWPMADYLPHKLFLKCLKCSRKLQHRRPLCKRCNIDYRKPLIWKDIKTERYYSLDVEREIHFASESFTQVSGDRFKCNAKIEVACNLLTILDRYVEHPNYLGFLARRSLHLCNTYKYINPEA